MLGSWREEIERPRLQRLKRKRLRVNTTA